MDPKTALRDEKLSRLDGRLDGSILQHFFALLRGGLIAFHMYTLFNTPYVYDKKFLTFGEGFYFPKKCSTAQTLRLAS